MSLCMTIESESSLRPSPVGYLSHTPLNQDDICTSVLNIDNKERSNLFPWNGQFSPQFVEALLERYATSGTRVLDPFCGSGTVLSEAARLGLAASGIEVNPAAYVLSRTYSLSNLSPQDRRFALDGVEAKLQSILPKGWPLLTSVNNTLDDSYQKALITLRDTSHTTQRYILESLIILADFFKGPDSQKLAKTWSRLRLVIDTLPHNGNSITVHHGDGRFPDALGSFDLVLTSPPYINVYNYHQQYRASAEALGWDLLKVARTEIGSNRKHRGNRFLTVIQYCLDLAITLTSLWPVTSDDARLIFVLGRESRVRGIPFLNGEIAARLAIDAVGYNLAMRQERVFTNRFGQRIYEDILHFTKGHLLTSNPQHIARLIAEKMLREALELAASEEIRNDIIDAISQCSSVSESPHFAPDCSYTKNNPVKTKGRKSQP